MSISGAISDSANTFIGGQMQGVYGAYGITPQMRQMTNQYVGQPLANIGGSAAGLIASNFQAMTSRQVAAMGMQQKSDLSTALSRNLVNTGLTVTGGVASVGGAIAAVGVPGGWAAGLGLMAAEGVMGDGAIGTALAGMTGSKWFGLDDSVFHPFTAAKEKVEFDTLNQTMLRNESYRFMSPGSRRNPYTMGLSKQDSQAWSKRINTWGSKMHMEDNDVGELLSSAIDNELVTNVNGIDDFEAKFTKQIKYIKNASKILNKSMLEISDMMGEFKQAGFSTDNFDLKTAELKTMSSLLGKSVDATKTFMLNSAKAFSQGTTLSVENQGNQATYNAAMINFGLSNAKATGNTATVDLINNFGGAMGASSTYRAGIGQMYANQSASIPMAFAFTQGTNGLTFDKSAFNEMYRGVMSGSISTQQMTAASAAKMQSWSGMNQVAYSQNAGQFILNQDETTVNQMALMTGTALRNTIGKPGDSLASVFSAAGYVDSNTAALMGTGLDSFSRYGASVNLSKLYTPYMQKAAAIQEDFIGSYTAGGKWTSKGITDALINRAVIDPMHALDNSYTAMLNMRGGMSSGESIANGVVGDVFDVSPASMRRKAATNYMITKTITGDIASNYDVINGTGAYKNRARTPVLGDYDSEIQGILTSGQGFSYREENNNGVKSTIASTSADFGRALGLYDKFNNDSTAQKLIALGGIKSTITGADVMFSVDDSKKTDYARSFASGEAYANAIGGNVATQYAQLKANTNTIINGNIDNSTAADIIKTQRDTAGFLTMLAKNPSKDADALKTVVSGWSTDLSNYGQVASDNKGYTSFVSDQAKKSASSSTTATADYSPASVLNGKLNPVYSDMVRRINGIDGAKMTATDWKNVNKFAASGENDWDTLLNSAPIIGASGDDIFGLVDVKYTTDKDIASAYGVDLSTPENTSLTGSLENSEKKLRESIGLASRASLNLESVYGKKLSKWMSYNTKGDADSVKAQESIENGTGLDYIKFGDKADYIEYSIAKQASLDMDRDARAGKTLLTTSWQEQDSLKAAGAAASSKLVADISDSISNGGSLSGLTTDSARVLSGLKSLAETTSKGNFSVDKFNSGVQGLLGAVGGIDQEMLIEAIKGSEQGELTKMTDALKLERDNSIDPKVISMANQHLDKLSGLGKAIEDASPDKIGEVYLQVQGELANLNSQAQSLMGSPLTGDNPTTALPKKYSELLDAVSIMQERTDKEIIKIKSKLGMSTAAATSAPTTTTTVPIQGKVQRGDILGTLFGKGD